MKSRVNIPRRWSWAGVLVVLGVSTMLLPTWAQPPGRGVPIPPGKGQAKPDVPALVLVSEIERKEGAWTQAELAEARLKLARAAITDLQRLVAGGQLWAADKSLRLWSRRLAETRRELGGDKADVIADLEAYLGFTKKVLDMEKTSYAKDTASRVDVFGAQYEVLEAETWLAQAKAR
jgi:hypothetical protein